MASRKERPSPSVSATEFPEHYEKVGGDGQYWHVLKDTRGVKRWTRGLSKEKYGGVRTEEDTERLIKEAEFGETMEEKPTHEGLGSLFDTERTEEHPMHEEDTTPEEVVEIEKETVMSR